MTRNFYETQEDIKREEEFARYLETVFKAKLFKTDARESVDYYATRDGTKEVRAMIEIKVRQYDFNEFPSLVLNLHKWISLINLSQVLPTILCVKWLDKAVSLKIKTDMRPSVYLGGRTTKQRDSLDKGLVVKIPNKFFKEI